MTIATDSPLVILAITLYLCGQVRAKNAASVWILTLLSLAAETLVWACTGDLMFTRDATTWLAPLMLGGLLLASSAERVSPVFFVAVSAAYSTAGTIALGAIAPQAMHRAILPAAAAGAAALAKFVGPRQDRFDADGSAAAIPGHHLPMSLLAVAILLAANSSNVLPVTTAAAVLAAAGVSFRRRGVIDVRAVLAAALASAVAGELPFRDGMHRLLAVGIGVLVGFGAAYVQPLFERRHRVDDVGGLTVPMLLASLLPLGLYNDLEPAFVALGAVAGGAALMVAVLWIVRCVGVAPRVSERAEYDGTDLAAFDVNAYPDFQQPLIRSHHLRQL